MGRNPQYFQWEEILNVKWEEIPNIFNSKKASTFSVGTVANPVGRVTLWFKLCKSVFNIHTLT